MPVIIVSNLDNNDCVFLGITRSAMIFQKGK